MHLVFISSFQYPDGGAGSSRSWATAQGMADLGHPVTFVLVTQVEPPSNLRHPGVKWITIAPSSWSRFPGNWRLRLITQLKAALSVVNRECAIDGVFIVNRDAWLINRSRTAAASLGIPTYHELTEFPDIVPFVGFRRSLEIWQLTRELRRLDGVLAISTALVSFLSSCGVSATALTGPVVDLAAWPLEPHERNQRVLSVGYAGSLSQEKDGVLNLLSAIARAQQIVGREFELRLEVLGGSLDSADLRAAKQTAGELGIISQVRFHGIVPSVRVQQVLKHCDVLALPRPASRQAQGGFPTKLGEYLALGRPVITTCVGDIPKYLSNRDCFMVQPGDVPAFADALVFVGRNQEEADRIGRAGHETAVEIFDRRRIGHTIASFITSTQKPSAEDQRTLWSKSPAKED